MLIDFDLPEALIAKHPSDQRDGCKMLVFDRKSQKIQHIRFQDLPQIMDENYLFILNNARVNPSRIFWSHQGKKQEIVFLKNVLDAKTSSVWEAIVSGKGLKIHQPYEIQEGLSFTLKQERKNSIALIEINQCKMVMEKILDEKGQLPLPPYIVSKRRNDGDLDYTHADEQNYQTIFNAKKGAVASPTAGLHFTNDTFENLKKKNIHWDFIHLSVGWGTFSPLTMHNFETQKLHPEFCHLSTQVAQKILQQKKQNKKILSVGTTTVRTLETWAQKGMSEDGFDGETDIFIYPPHHFLVSDAMLTNFHIPKSSLLLLVASFLGKGGEKKIIELYQEAIAQNYRFYSFGDCMLIL